MPGSPTTDIPPEDNPATITEQPDGFYWQDNSTEKMNGPFTTRREAMEDLQYQVDSTYEVGEIDSAFEVGETLQEAEAEIGISDWIDPDTGEPAEGSMPHLND